MAKKKMCEKCDMMVCYLVGVEDGKKAQNDTRPAVTMRETDLADWKEHKEEFKKWMAQKPADKCPILGNPCPHMQKPSAPAGLVEELREWCQTQSKPWKEDEYHHGVANGYESARYDVDEILSRYRPAPSCEHIGQYSNNCRYSNNDFKCSLPPKKECVMGFISKCDGTVPPSVRPAPSCEEGLRAEIEILVEKYKDDENLVEGFIWGNEVVSDLESSLSRHPSPEVKGEAREHLEWKGSIDATAKAIDKKREDNKGGI